MLRITPLMTGLYEVKRPTIALSIVMLLWRDAYLRHIWPQPVVNLLPGLRASYYGGATLSRGPELAIDGHALVCYGRYPGLHLAQ